MILLTATLHAVSANRMGHVIMKDSRLTQRRHGVLIEILLMLLGFGLQLSEL